MTLQPTKPDLSGQEGAKIQPGFEPAHGRDLELSLKALVSFQTARTRDRHGTIVLVCSISACVVAFGYGLYANDFHGLERVWGVTGPLIGWVIGFYFHRGGEEEK